MSKPSRLVTTTILGAVFGIICMLLSWYIVEVAFWPIGISLLLHHTVMGFTIGASSLKVNWAVHGVLWGFLFGIFLLVGGIGTYPDLWALIMMPIVWGFLIEFLAIKVFKQPQ